MASCETPQEYSTPQLSPIAQNLFTVQNNGTLHQLQSEEQRTLLDAIERLRSANLSNQLSLPQLIVCGDQSSGKSSVLEAISGVRFPDSDVLCTRFASELILRDAETFSFSVKIEPAEHRSLQEQESLRKFESSSNCSHVQEFPKVISEAAEHMREVAPDSEFFEDRLVAKVNGPGLPRLIMVDLPGLIHASSKQGNNNDVQTVKKIVEAYMRQPNSIILAIVTADNNLANQEVLDLIKKHDVSLDRTLGIMTKPDLVHAGSQSETQAIQCVLNESAFIALKFGWHVLRNRNFACRDISLMERDFEESNFFASGNWRSVPEEDRGSRTLRTKLSEILLKAIRGTLPSMVEEINSKVGVCEKLAESLGQPRETAVERRCQLNDMSLALHSLVKAAMYGQYNSDPDFFFDGPDDYASPRQLRTCLRNSLEAFAADMHTKGMRFGHADAFHPATSARLRFFARRSETAVTQRMAFVTAENLEQSVTMHMKQCKAFEPNGTVPPLAYTSILSFQCSRWETLAKKCARECWMITKEFFEQALLHHCPPYIAARVVKGFVDNHFDRTERQLMEKLQEVLKPYRNRDYFTLNEAKLEAQIRQSRQALLTNDGNDSQIELTKAQDVLIWVFAAYEIALSTFLDNFATLTVEFCLIESLPKLFSAADVGRMSSEELRQMTDEPPHVVKARSTNAAQLEALRYALRVCNQNTEPSWTTKSVPERDCQVGQMQSVTENPDDAGVQRPTRTGTADDITIKLQNLSVSSPISQDFVRSEAASVDWKAKGRMADIDSSNPTPPETPPRVSLSADQLPGVTTVHSRSHSSGERARRKTRIIPAEYGLSSSPAVGSYRAPHVADADEPTSEES